MEHTITLEPRFLTAQVREHLRMQLYRQMEGSCSGRHGYVIAIVSVDHIESGLVQDSTGTVSFTIKFQSLVMKPFKNEVLDARIVTVNKMGFFASIGPLQVFVSNHLIPEVFRFEPNMTPQCYVSETDDDRIAPGAAVRLRVVGTRIDAAEMFAIGTIKEDCLGLVSALQSV